jgi:hydroxyacylglutathione hydrolase
MIIEQIPVGDMAVFCYLVGCEETGQAAAIDPAGDTEGILEVLEKQNLRLVYIVSTHGHADHTCGNLALAARTGAKTVMHALDDDFFTSAEGRRLSEAFGLCSAPPAEIRVTDGDRLALGTLSLEFIHTPGHSPGAMCVRVGNNLFTGDTLFVGAVGRTDLPAASFQDLLRSIEEKLLPLPRETVIWPGHDYGDRPSSTLAEEMETNPYITDLILDK